jgi:hypothetical protein
VEGAAQSHQRTMGCRTRLKGLFAGIDLTGHLMQNQFGVKRLGNEGALYEIASLTTLAHLSLNEPSFSLGVGVNNAYPVYTQEPVLVRLSVSI